MAAPVVAKQRKCSTPEQQELFARAQRRKLPNERKSITHKFSIGGHEGYITVGKYDDGTPGEIFIKMAKEGSTLSGIMDAFALSVSIALQYGVPLRALVDKFVNSRFEPSGYTGNPEIRYAKSVVDYIGRWLGGEIHLAGLSRCAMRQRQQPKPPPLPSQQRQLPRWHPLPRKQRRRKHPRALALPLTTPLLLRVRHADDAQRQLLQVLELRQHLRLQLARIVAIKTFKGVPVNISTIGAPFLFSGKPSGNGSLRRTAQ